MRPAAGFQGWLLVIRGQDHSLCSPNRRLRTVMTLLLCFATSSCSVHPDCTSDIASKLRESTHHFREMPAPGSHLYSMR